MPALTIAEESFYYEQCGQGRPVLFVHGFPLDHALWSDQLTELAEFGRLIAPDLRGFGKSHSARVEGMTLERIADDLIALLDGLGIVEPVVLCGLSMGGYIAFEFVRKYPHRLAGLVLCDTRAAADSPEVKAARQTMAERVRREGVGHVIEAMRPRMFSPRTLEQRPQVVERWKAMVQRCPVETIAAALRAMGARPDSTALLPQIDRPALVIVGSDDVTSPPEEMRAMANALPRSRFVVIPEAGHLTPMENPTAFNAALGEWLGQLV